MFMFQDIIDQITLSKSERTVRDNFIVRDTRTFYNANRCTSNDEINMKVNKKLNSECVFQMQYQVIYYHHFLR